MLGERRAQRHRRVRGDPGYTVAGKTGRREGAAARRLLRRRRWRRSSASRRPSTRGSRRSSCSTNPRTELRRRGAAPVFSEIMQSALTQYARAARPTSAQHAVRRRAGARRRPGQQLHRAARRRPPGAPRPAGRGRRPRPPGPQPRAARRQRSRAEAATDTPDSLAADTSPSTLGGRVRCTTSSTGSTTYARGPR